MRLITQNLLVCNKRTCQAAGVVNFPLRLNVTTWNDCDDDNSMPCTKPLMLKLSEKLEWSALRQTVHAVSENYIFLARLQLSCSFIFSLTGESIFQRRSTPPLSTTRRLANSFTCYSLRDKSWRATWYAPTVSACTRSRVESRTCSSTRMRFDLLRPSLN